MMNGRQRSRRQLKLLNRAQQVWRQRWSSHQKQPSITMLRDFHTLLFVYFLIVDKIVVLIRWSNIMMTRGILEAQQHSEWGVQGDERGLSLHIWGHWAFGALSVSDDSHWVCKAEPSTVSTSPWRSFLLSRINQNINISMWLHSLHPTSSCSFLASPFSVRICHSPSREGKVRRRGIWACSWRRLRMWESEPGQQHIMVSRQEREQLK